MKILQLFLLLLLFAKYSYSQEEWIARYNGSGNNTDVATALAVDNNGNIYVTGYSYNMGSFYDYVTIKYSPMGDVLWTTSFNGNGNDNDYAFAMTLDAAGNVYVTGQSFKSSSSYDYATVKYNPNGNIEWSVYYNGTGNGIDYAKKIAVDDLGNVYVTGQSYGSLGSSYDYATIKYNSSGIQQWAARNDGPVNGNDGANSIAVDLSYNVYVTGQSLGQSSSLDYATIKYNSSGVEQWNVRYNGTANDIDIGSSIVVDILGNVYVTGYSRGPGTLYDYATIKYDMTGTELWVSRYNGPFNKSDVPSSMIIDASGNIFITGVANNDVSGVYSNYATIKYNPDGSSQWIATFNSAYNNNDSATSITLDGSGNVFVTGKSFAPGIGYDYATVKYNSSGIQQGMSRYNGSGNSNDVSNAVALDNSGNIFITGASYGSVAADDYTTIKYSSLAGIQSQNIFIPSEYKLSQNYPNPFNPATMINYELPLAGFSVLKIYDLNGKEITTLVNEQQQAGTYSVDFNAAGISSGTYFYTLNSGDFSQTKKMILIK